MFINRIPDLNRRAFLKRATALSVMGAGAPLALNLAAAGEAAAMDASDYKALVCIFMYGGNDYANTFVPYDLHNYDQYSAIRGGKGRKGGGIALGYDSLAHTVLTPVASQALTDNLQYALAPELTSVAALFNAGHAAIQLNVGPLVVPLTLRQYTSSDRKTYPLPPKLFSHNDQQSVWQSLGSEGATVGWGGRIGDLALTSNATSAMTCISASGNAVYVSGNTALQYEISPSGAIPIWPAKGDYAIAHAMKTLITQPRTHMLENEFTRVTQRSMELEGIVNTALNPVALKTNFGPDPKANTVANQLKVVARLIGARQALGSKRQVFFVSIGGFDHHNNLMLNHPGLMKQLNEGIGAFYEATVEMGVADKVTTFTASDFGRTLSSNGDGSDHGWGSHHFVVGGAVKGGQYYGTAPHVSISSDDQVGQGRLLPSTSVDQFAATLARWFGVPDSDMASILPNIGHFSTANLGFMV